MCCVLVLVLVLVLGAGTYASRLPLLYRCCCRLSLLLYCWLTPPHFPFGAATPEARK